MIIRNVTVLFNVCVQFEKMVCDTVFVWDFTILPSGTKTVAFIDHITIQNDQGFH
jgi:hypothetical protein